MLPQQATSPQQSCQTNLLGLKVYLSEDGMASNHASALLSEETVVDMHPCWINESVGGWVGVLLKVQSSIPQEDRGLLRMAVCDWTSRRPQLLRQWSIACGISCGSTDTKMLSYSGTAGLHSSFVSTGHSSILTGCC